MKNRDILWIFIVSLAVRLAYMLFFVGLNAVPDADTLEYNAYAVNLISGNGFFNNGFHSFRPPLYPFFLSGVYLIFGQSFAAIKLIQALLSSLIPVIAYRIALMTGSHDRRSALGIGLLSACYFGLFCQPAHVLAETVFTLTLMALVYCLMRTGDGARFTVFSGILLGLANLTRSVLLTFVPFLLFWYYRHNGIRKATWLSILAAGVMLLTILPWTARNYRVHGKLVPISTQVGLQFLSCHNPNSQGRWTTTLCDLKKFSGLPEAEQSDRYFAEGLSWLKRQPPLELAKLYSIRALSFFHPFITEGRLAYDLTYGLIFPFWIFGMFALFRQGGKSEELFFLLILSQFVLALIFFGEPRYRNVLSPFIIMFAFTGAKKLWANAARRPALLWGGSAWAAVNLFAFFFFEQAYGFVKIFVNTIRAL